MQNTFIRTVKRNNLPQLRTCENRDMEFCSENYCKFPDPKPLYFAEIVKI